MTRFHLLLPSLLLLSGCTNPVDPPSPNDSSKPVSNESADSMPSDDPLSAGDFASMKLLHQQVVEHFVAMTGFGPRRMVLPPELDDAVTRSATSEPPKGKGSSPRTLAYRPGDPERNLHVPFSAILTPGRTPTMNVQKQTWSTKRIQLVGLSVHPEPVVYETEQVPGMKEIGDIPTRELDAFEKRSLVAIQKGAPVMLDRNGSTARMFAPIYAGKACVKCHDQPGQLLGAFSYTLEHGKILEPAIP